MTQERKSTVIEEGNVYFLYRPRVQEEDPEKIGDIQRLYTVLSPYGKDRYRLIVIGRKRLPEVHDGGEPYWGFVDRVVKDPRALRDELEEQHYGTKTRGERQVPATRPAGEGVYSIVSHEGHTHFAYALELPERPGEVQQELNIEKEASYIISVKNPEQPSPPGVGLGKGQKARFPKHLQERFGRRRFLSADPPELLDYEGVELLMIGAHEDPEKELGVALDPQDETLATAEIFKDLRLRKSQHPVQPLITGEWK
ncbi:hypothetical protein [Methylocaldum sp.]|uniref:hypothetical protein n=1 Tax=Methylocaldum sp. TaxID=1969727 RepID=UPI002D45E4B5|nr:hypothetical protein [Methylocaldum sp.]HYE34367.1 hypothetical protein [Methylocaldum sp.]